MNSICDDDNLVGISDLAGLIDGASDGK